MMGTTNYADAATGADWICGTAAGSPVVDEGAGLGDGVQAGSDGDRSDTVWDWMGDRARLRSCRRRWGVCGDNLSTFTAVLIKADSTPILAAGAAANGSE